MNTLKLESQRNFPLTTDALKFMQDAYASLEQLALLAGYTAILSGCTITGHSASDGVVIIGGRLMPFRGGTIQTNVRVVTNVATITVGTGVREQTTYHAEFGTSTNPADNVAWSTLAASRLPTIAELSTKANILTSAVDYLNANKVDKVAGNRLITSDEIDKLDSIAYGANDYVHPSNPAHQIGEIEGLEDAIDKISALELVTEENITPFTGYHMPTSSYYFVLQKFGRVYNLRFRIYKDNPGSPVRLGRISENHRPVIPVSFVIRSSASSDKAWAGSIGSTGFIECSNTDPYTELMGCVTWIE